MATIHQAFLKLKNGWGQSLRWRVLTGFLTTLLVFLGLQGYLSLHAGYTGIQDQIAQSNWQLADLAVHGISAKYDAIFQQVVFLRADMASYKTLLDAQASDMLDFRRNWPLTYRALYLFDAEGQLLIHLTDPLDRLLAIKTPAEILNRAPITPGTDVLDAWREAGDRGGTTYVSPVRIVGADQLPVITLGMALASPEQPVSGARRLVVEIDLRDIWRGVDKFYVGQTGREFITSADGLIIAHPDRAYIGQRLPPALQPVLAGQGGQVKYLDPLSNRVMLAAFMPVSKQSGWGLIIEQQQSEALLPATRILAVSIGIMLAASALATLIALWLSRSITRPILHLAQVTQLIARTGDLHHAQVAAFGRRDEIGQLALAFNQMIASLRQTEAVLRESERRFRNLADNSPDAIYVLDLVERRMVFFNRQEFCGYSRQELESSSSVLMAVHPDEQSAVSTHWQSLLTGDPAEARVIEYRLRHKKGDWEWLQSRETILARDKHGRPTQVLVTLTLIAERKRAEEEIRKLNAGLEARVIERTAELDRQRTRARAILDAMGEGVVFTDLAGTIEYINPAMERLTGFTAQEALGQNPRLWQSGQTPLTLYQQLWDTLSRGGTWQGELVNRRQDGRLYEAALTAAPLTTPDRQIAGFVGVLRDITRQKELDRLKDQFVSNVNHELRTPLTSIMLNLDLIDHSQPEKHPHHLAVMRREAERLCRLVEDMLDIARLDRETVPIELSPIDLHQLLGSLVADRATVAAERGLTLEFLPTAESPLALAEASMLTQVVSNLITNALNYTPAGGSVTVQTHRQRAAAQDWITLTVRDTGPGIAAHEMPHLFERFYRGEVGRKAKTPGTGLGLAISKEIMDRLGGRITVESQPATEGKGTAFTVWLRPQP